jgi:hypothetical protein
LFNGRFGVFDGLIGGGCRDRIFTIVVQFVGSYKPFVSKFAEILVSGAFGMDNRLW